MDDHLDEDQTFGPPLILNGPLIYFPCFSTIICLINGVSFGKICICFELKINDLNEI